MRHDQWLRLVTPTKSNCSFRLRPSGLICCSFFFVLCLHCIHSFILPSSGYFHYLLAPIHLLLSCSLCLRSTPLHICSFTLVFFLYFHRSVLARRLFGSTDGV